MADKLDKISVIIPVYNVAKFLNESIDSIINQTYSNLEIIIIDDGSNDGSEQICDEYLKIDSRIIVIHQSNQGLSAARNRGLDIMTGQYVIFIDPDDVILPEYTEILYYTMKKKKTDCVICNYSMVLSEGKIRNTKKLKNALDIKSGLYNKKEMLSIIVNGNINMSVWNKLYKKDLWNDIRFPEGYLYEDVVTTYKIFLKARKTYMVNDILLIYRIRKGSITNTNSLKNVLDLYEAYFELDKLVRNDVGKLFSEDQYNYFCEKNLFIFISRFLGNRFIKDDEDKKIDIVLKEYIDILSKKVDKEKISIKHKIIYFMYKRCPNILKVVYKVYIFFKNIEMSVFNK